MYTYKQEQNTYSRRVLEYKCMALSMYQFLIMHMPGSKLLLDMVQLNGNQALLLPWVFWFGRRVAAIAAPNRNLPAKNCGAT